MRRRWRLSQKSSVLSPTSRRPTGSAGSPITGSGICRARAPHARRSRTTGSSQQCLAVIYDKLGRHADAEAVLSKMKAALGDTAAYQYATIYAQWGNRAKALEWLETALRLRDPGLVVSEDRPAHWTPCAKSRASRRLSGS